MKKLRRKLRNMPNPYLRKTVGVLLIIGGIFWFLPILGLWMIPLGILVLSVDFPWARRAHLRMYVIWRRMRARRRRTPG